MNTTTPTDYAALAVPGVRSLQPYQPGKPESELAREYGISDIVKLASNENPLGPPFEALDAVRASIAELARYPDGGGYVLRQRLAARHQLDPAAVTLGNGSNDVLELLARAYLDEHSEAVFSAHAFAVYYLASQAVGARQRVVPACGDSAAMPYGHELQGFRAALGERTRLVYIANPNNPTGTWLDGDELEAFIAAVPARTLVVVDEAYVEYAEAAPGYRSVVPLLARYPNLAVTRTFSKAHGLAGLRVGYCLSHPAVAEVLNRVRQPFNVSLPALAGAEAALGADAHIARSVALNERGLRQLRDGCERLGLGFLPSAGNFLCIHLGRPGAEVFRALLPKGVIVRPIANYAMPEHIRVSVGLDHENRRFLAALAEVLE